MRHDSELDEMLRDVQSVWDAPLQPIPTRDALADERERAAAARREAAAERMRKWREDQRNGVQTVGARVNEDLREVLIAAGFLDRNAGDSRLAVQNAVQMLLDRAVARDIDANGDA